jgi:hypothetical protein
VNVDNPIGRTPERLLESKPLKKRKAGARVPRVHDLYEESGGL